MGLKPLARAAVAAATIISMSTPLSSVQAGGRAPSTVTQGDTPSATAACPQPQSYEEIYSKPAAAATGVRAEWQLRTASAPDWAAGGHTNTTVWLGTDGDPNTWVEVGVTAGFHGENTYAFYSAHQYWTGSRYAYQDVKIGKAAVLGRIPMFSVYQSGSVFRGDVTDTAGSAGIGWSGHTLPAQDYNIGVEYTCPASSRLDRSYVMTNQYQRQSVALGDRS